MANVCIKITRGGCGIKYTDEKGNARHALKTPADKPFDCDAEQAERLVALGVAEYVAKSGVQVVENQTNGKDDGVPKTGHLDAEQLEKMDYNDLKKLAAEMGVKPEGKTKADYIAAIAAVEVEIDDGDDGEDDEDDDELPDLNAADPE